MLHGSQVHNAAGIVPMTYSNDIIGYRTSDLLACSALPQPTAPQPVRIVLFDSFFCRNESLSLTRNCVWTFSILKLCDSDRSLVSITTDTIHQLRP